MVQINFTKNVKKFELNIVHKLDNFPQKIRQNYIDELADWRNLLEDIFTISTFNIKDESNIFNDLKNILLSSEIFIYYNEMCSKLTDFINKLKPKEICSHYNVSHANIRGEIDLLVDNTLFEIKTNQLEIATTANVSQTLLYSYLVQKKERKIDTIILYNPLTGEMTKFDTTNVNFKQIANIYYGNFKNVKGE